jgi:phosphatidate cytidylyltransferase
MLKQRTLTALTLAPLAIALILFAPTGLLAVVAAVAFLFATWEWTRMLGLRTAATRTTVVAVHAAMLLALWFARGTAAWWIVIALGVAWWPLAALWLRSFTYAAAPTRENTAIKLVAGVFIVVPAWAALVTVHGSGERGPWWALFGLMLIWVADSGAYLAGSRWGGGRAKLAPRISPGKTWVGVYGALASSAIVGFVGAWLLGVRGFALVGVFVLAMITVVCSIVGDLFESLIKRHANVKDSGDLFPGHGGMFDRLDSVFAAMPVWAGGLALITL